MEDNVSYHARIFCKKTETIKESARMHKIIKSCSDKKEKLESVYKSNNTLTENTEKTLEEMEKTHFKNDPSANNITNKQHINQHNLQNLQPKET